jgi:lysophospholipase L1-like esterase
MGLVMGLAGCGHGGSTGPTPNPSPTYTVTATVFYDENGNGILDTGENVRLPQVEVVVGSVSARSASGSGQAVVTGVPAGSQQVAIRTETVPFFFVPGSPVTVEVPQTGGDIRFPMRLPIGDNHPNVYMAFGDSLTTGVGSTDGNGYRVKLQNLLAGYLGRAEVVDQGKDGTFSTVGADRIPGSLHRTRPAYNLILYGTNDWNDQSCQGAPAANCYTIDSLRIIVEETKAAQSLPVLATLTPANPKINSGRNEWIDATNARIKALAREQGALLADLNADFKAQGGDLSRFYYDDIHPNDAGYDVVARSWMKAITQPRSAAAASTF